MSMDGRMRSSRKPYVSESCSECRRRKIKCSGQQPCNHCANDSLTCIYNRKGPRRRPARVESDIDALRSQVSELQQQLQSMSTSEQVPQNLPSVAGTRSQVPPVATYRGLTSPEYTLDVATRTLQDTLASTGSSAPTSEAGLRKNHGVSTISETFASLNPLAKTLVNDPLHGVSIVDTRQLIITFINGPGAVYPVISERELLDAAESITNLLHSVSHGASSASVLASFDRISSLAAIELKLVLATGSALRSCGSNRLVQALFGNVQERLQGLFFALPSLALIRVWFLVGQLLYHIDEGLQASRAIAHAARLCLELGLNRETTLQRYRDNKAGGDPLAAKLLWSIFSLDRRASVDLGMPFILQDGDVSDVDFPMDDDVLYLKTMGGLAILSGEGYHLASKLSDRSVPIPVADIASLDEQISRWHEQIPAGCMISVHELETNQQRTAFTQSRLFRNSVLFFRENQLRNLLYRPVLYSDDRIASHWDYACRAVDTACQAIRMLSALNEHADLVRVNALCVKHFLVTAFSSLTLVIAAAAANPSLHIPPISEGFGLAMSLFRALKERSPALEKTWDAIRHVESFMPHTKSAETVVPPSQFDSALGSAAYDMTTFSQLAPQLELTDENLSFFLTEIGSQLNPGTSSSWPGPSNLWSGATWPDNSAPLGSNWAYI